MTSSPVLSVVTGTYNRLTTLQRLITSVRHTVPASIPYEVIVADNGSTDGTAAWLAEQATIRTVQLGEPVGAVKAFTAAARQAQGKYVLLATDDCHFPPLAILRAIRYLEETPACGAVAFGHNKYLRDKFEVMVHPAHDEHGWRMNVIYPQIALVRRWLGDEVGWWGGDHPVMKEAFTYAGDNFLGAGIWERGYTVDSVDGVYEYEDVIEDAPRQMNTERHTNDARLFYSLYPPPDGHLVRETPTLTNPDRRQLRVLCALSYTPRIPHHRRNKAGWRNAWGRVGLVYDYDYQGRHAQGANVVQELAAIAQAWQPHIIFTQVHTPSAAFGLETAAHLRSAAPKAVMINWNGDYWPANYLRPDAIEMLRYYDLQLVQNAWVIEPYCEQGICAAFIPHSFEPVDKLPHSQRYPAVFAGNAYDEWRVAFVQKLMQWGVTVFGNAKGLQTNGNTLYDYAGQRAVYRHAKVAVSIMHFEQQVHGYVSNRLWEIMAAGGALCLQQHSPGLDELTGLQAGVHYVEWRTLDELHDLIQYYTDPAHEAERARIAKAGHQEVLARHSFDARLDMLIDQILPQVLHASG